jgi:hypothetical protein
MPSVYFDFDEELGRWKPNARGREAVNARRMTPGGRPVRGRRGGNREWNNPNRPPSVRDYARSGGNLFTGGRNAPEVNRLRGGGNAVRPRPVDGGAARTRARRDLGQNAASRGGGGGGVGVPSTRPQNGGRGGGRVARGLRNAVDSARNRVADRLEGVANRRRRRR